MNKVPRLRTRLVFKTLAGNKEHIVIGQKLNGDFVKFSGPLKKHKLYQASYSAIFLQEGIFKSYHSMIDQGHLLFDVKNGGKGEIE